MSSLFSDERFWQTLLSAVAVWAWGAVPWRRWIKSPLGADALGLLKGALAVGAVRLGWVVASTGHEADWVWGIGFLVTWASATSPFAAGEEEGQRLVPVSFGALAVAGPWAALAGTAVGLATWITRESASRRAWAEIAALCGAAVGAVVAYPLGVHLWIGLLWFFFLLQRQDVSLSALLRTQGTGSRSSV